MINNVVITGRFREIKNNELFLKYEESEKNQLIRIKIPKGLQEELSKYIMEDDIIGIKGYLEVDDLQQIKIVATKITFLSSKKKAQN